MSNDLNRDFARRVTSQQTAKEVITDIQRLAAESEARKAAEAKEREDLINGFNQEGKARQEAKEREKAAEYEASENARKEADELDLKNRVRASHPGMSNDDFERLYPRLRDEFLIKETDAQARQNSETFRRQW